MDLRAYPQQATPKRIRRSLGEWFTGERQASPSDPDEHLTYEALLALRGWRPSDFEAAEPEFLEAVRFALFAEATAPDYLSLRKVQDTDMRNVSDKGALGMAKMQAATLIPRFRSVLFLDAEDDDG